MGPVVVVMTSSVRRCHLPDSSLFRTVARVTFSSVSWLWESAPACTAASSPQVPITAVWANWG
jgi:hypothetical protein